MLKKVKLRKHVLSNNAEEQRLQKENEYLCLQNYRLGQRVKQLTLERNFLLQRISMIETKQIPNPIKSRSLHRPRVNVSAAHIFHIPTRTSQTIEANISNNSERFLRKKMIRKPEERKLQVLVQLDQYIDLYRGVFVSGSIEDQFLSKLKKHEMYQNRENEGIIWLKELPLGLIRLSGFLHRLSCCISECSGYSDNDAIYRAIESFLKREFDCDKVSIYYVDYNHRELKSKNNQIFIRMPFSKGIAGHSAQTNELINQHDAYKNEFFNRQVDQLTGYSTRSMLCVPILNHLGSAQAVLQLINKKSKPFYFCEFDEILASAAGESLRHMIVKCLQEQEGLIHNTYLDSAFNVVFNSIHAKTKQQLIQLAQQQIHQQYKFQKCKLFFFLLGSMYSVDSGGELRVCSPRGVVQSCRDMGAHIMVQDRRSRVDFDQVTDIRTTNGFAAVPLIRYGKVVGVAQIASYNLKFEQMKHVSQTMNIFASVEQMGWCLFQYFRELPDLKAIHDQGSPKVIDSESQYMLFPSFELLQI